MNEEDETMLMLANSLSVMTRRPNPAHPIILPNADGTYPEIYTPETHTPEAHTPETYASQDAAQVVVADAADVAEEATFVPPSEELGTPAFTAEMAQAILTGQAPPTPPPTLIPTGDSGSAVADASNYAQTDYSDTSSFAAPPASDASSFNQQPQNVTPNIPQYNTPEPASDEPDLLAGFDPSKYLSGASATPPPLPAPAASATPNTPANSGEIGTSSSQESAYSDIEEGAGAGGQKDSREAMQMLRELSVLKGN